MSLQSLYSGNSGNATANGHHINVNGTAAPPPRPPQRNQRRRRRFGEEPQNNEDASQLQFGPAQSSLDFAAAEHLTITEAALILSPRKMAVNQADTSGNDVLRKTIEFCDQFGLSSAHEQVVTTREIINNTVQKLDKFEVAKFLDLQPDDVDQVKTLIPSMGRLTEEDLVNLVTLSVGLRQELLVDETDEMDLQ
ncbi:hypothetical protein SmJEL517_g04175 [Synchytrium microbalum]|uniref:RNA polymerase Rpb4/RPC9 core domain-containing protein n=1 Tax=Synchytrium microbalum TaxID=1806994 RepID=A0A507C096_9FUNG|nr:uncharacterized protein SmJEL517_g04175 [Synchytrium microbalum]TPX32788.1 hypothetical protein SmJEL517_g04175 [Synchytrium microbalum]